METQNLPIDQRLDPWSNGVGSGLNDLFTPFLGPLVNQDKTNPYELRPVDKFNMPEAYLGRNLFLRDTMNDWIFTATQTWYTQRVMPWIITEEIHMVWTQWEANAHFLGIVPEQSTARLVTQERQMRRASLVRRGIAYEFEHGFVKTAMGRASFMAAFGQMARSVQETANAEVIRSLVNCHRPQQQYLRDHGIIKMGELDKYLQRDRNRFALVQKVKNGMSKLDADVNAEMFIYGGKANAWIMTEDVSIYCTFTRSEVTDFYMAGQAGPDRINNTGNRQLAASNTTGELDRVEPTHFVRNVPVLLARAFVGGSAGEQLDLLSRTRQVGEYNTMFDENPNWNNYKSESRAIAIYNQAEDKFNRISLAQALRECGRFDRNTGEPLIAVRNRYGDVDAHEGDFDQDFLVFRDPTTTVAEHAAKKAVKYIGDISYEFIESDLLRNVGRTIVGALKTRGIPQSQIDLIIVDLDKTRQTLNSPPPSTGGAPKATYTSDKDLTGAYDNVASVLAGILGNENAFFDTETTAGSSSSPYPRTLGERFWSTFGARGAVLITKTRNFKKVDVYDKDGKLTGKADAEDRSARMETVRVNSRIGASIGAPSALDKAMLGTLRAALPATHRDQVQAIIDGPGHTMAKAEQIRDAVFQMVNDKVPNLRWNNLAAAKSWYDERIAQYQERIGGSMRQEEPEEEEQVDAPVQSEVQYAYALPGRQLPAGWTYVHSAAASRQVRPSNSPIPHCAEAIPFVAQAMDAAASALLGSDASSRRRQYADFDDQSGLSRVGMLNPGSYDERKERGDARFKNDTETRFGYDATSRYRNLGELLGRIAAYNLSPMEKICASLYLGCRVTEPAMLSLIDSDIPVPFNFAFFRPHWQVRTRIAIKVADKGDAGNMFFGHSDLQLAHAANIKTGLANYTCYMGAVVHTPKNVYVVPDIMCYDYMGGGDCEFWNSDSYRAASWAINEGVARSIICVALPYAERKMPNPMDTSGRFYTEYKSGLLTADKFQQLHYSTAFFYNQMYDFHSANGRRRGNDQPSLNAGRAHLNRIMWAGAQFSWNAQKEDYSRYRPNTGHWGHTYEGVAPVRVGDKNEQMREPNYSNYSVM